MKLLIVCHGNINRSPLLSGLLASNPNFEIRQGALKSIEDPKWRPQLATKKMRMYVLNRGVDILEHRSSKLTLANMYWADKIIYFDNGNRKRLWNFAPELEDKFVPAGQYINEDSVRDPNYFTAESYEFKEVVAQIFAIAEEINKNGI